MLLFLFHCIIWLLRRIEDFFVFLNDVDGDCLEEPPESSWESIKKDLESIPTEKLGAPEAGEENACALDTLVPALKRLRTLVTRDSGSRHIFKQRDEFNKFFEQLLSIAVTSPDAFDKDFAAIKYMLHVFLNLLNGGDEYEKKLKRQWLHQNYCKTFLELFSRGPNGELASRTFYEVCAIIYNIHIDFDIENRQLTCNILEFHRTCANNKNGNEYLDFLVGKLMNGTGVWKNFNELTTEARVELLLCLREIQIDRETNLIIKLDPVPEVCLHSLINKYLISKNVIYEVGTEDRYLEFQEVALILELLAHFSGEERYLPLMQSNKDILIETGAILINVVRLGRLRDNPFRPLQRLAEITNPAREVRSDPIYRFKAGLVRLIGNLCWKNQQMQDLARAADLIPALLECSNIDAKNPFITQWMILAIRNICENNVENQRIIGGLNRQGMVRTEILQELGITLPEEDNLADNDDNDWVTF